MSQQRPAEAIFFRQIHPSHFSSGFITSQAFIPFPKDMGGLTVDDGNLTTSEQSWIRATGVCGLTSCGTWGVSMLDVDSATEMNVRPDPQLCNEAHYLIEFPDFAQEGLTKSAVKREWKKRAQHLAIRASNRGSLYQPCSD
jgi:hypothetical protein